MVSAFVIVWNRIEWNLQSTHFAQLLFHLLLTDGLGVVGATGAFVAAVPADIPPALPALPPSVTVSSAIAIIAADDTGRLLDGTYITV